MAALRGDISFRYLKQFFLGKYYLKNNYLTLRSKVKVPRRSLWYVTHHLHPYTNYNWPIWKDKQVMVRTELRWKEAEEKIRLKQYIDYDVPNWFLTSKNFYRSPFSKWSPQYRKNLTLFDFKGSFWFIYRHFVCCWFAVYLYFLAQGYINII
jgi:hypothetical protein